MYHTIFKRIIDIIFSLIGIIILLPVICIIALLIVADSKGPVFFKQKRVGIYKSHFNILKFRTMYITSPKDVPTHLLDKPDIFITRVGKHLRKTSLDELPQIINVFIGNMSLVGPRPALWNQFDLIAEREKYGANDVLPGLTGWAQINGRDELPLMLKAKYDGEYVRKMSLIFDLYCFLKTISYVFRSNGVVEGKIDNQRFT